MKTNILYSLFLLFTVSLYAQQVPVTYDELPKQAKDFLTKHFTEKVHHTIKEVNNRDVVYDVVMNDDTEIKFSQVGRWQMVDGKNKKIPYTILQMPIAEYVKSTHPKNYIVKITKTELNYLVTLNNGINLTFDVQGIYTKTN